jgi:hypothetical protein
MDDALSLIITKYNPYIIHEYQVKWPPVVVYAGTAVLHTGQCPAHTVHASPQQSAIQFDYITKHK